MNPGLGRDNQTKTGLVKPVPNLLPFGIFADLSLPLVFDMELGGGVMEMFMSIDRRFVAPLSIVMGLGNALVHNRVCQECACR